MEVLLEMYFLLLAYVLWNYRRYHQRLSDIKHCGGGRRVMGKAVWNTIYRYIYNLYLLILAINITVKFTIHLEHTRKASFQTIPALVVWSRLNISFQKICINLHRPYTVHKLWKGYFFQLHFLCNSPDTARLPATNVIHSFLRSLFPSASKRKNNYGDSLNPYVAAYNT